MKHLLICLFATLSISSFANQSSYFELNEEALNAEFETLNTLEEAVLSSPEMTVSQAVDMNLMTVAQGADLPHRTSNGNGTFAFEWEGFLWGFLCCPIGLFTVAVNKNKSHDTKISYWIGVAAYSVLNIVYGVAIATTNGGMM